MTNILIIQHVGHERLGSFEPVFQSAGCALTLLHAAGSSVKWPSVDAFDGIVVMGGPMSVYEQKKYPFLARELKFLQEALKRKTPILGVCLGSQLLAHALGATVKPNAQKEIGWYPVMRETGADGDALFEPFGQTETVFQWHGDTFELPRGAVQLASSPLCTQQAFRYGSSAYGLQFHVEVTEAMVRLWLSHPANKRELTKLRGVVDPMAIKRQNSEHIGRLQKLSRHVARTFCNLASQGDAVSGRSSDAQQKASSAKR